MENEKDITLTPREERFCEAYVKLGKKEAAAIEAGYSEKSAAVAASRLLKKAKILSHVQTLRARAREELGINSDWAILQALDIYKKCLKTEPIKVWDYENHRMVNSSECKFDAKNAIAALELICKLTGISEADNDKINAAINIINNVNKDD